MINVWRNNELILGEKEMEAALAIVRAKHRKRNYFREYRKKNRERLKEYNRLYMKQRREKIPLPLDTPVSDLVATN